MHTAHHEDDAWYRTLAKSILGSRGPFYLRLAKINPFHRAAVIKCPMGLMTTEYLYHEFNVRPVIIVRHPVSLIASLKRMEWWLSVGWFRSEPQLMEDYLADEPDLPNRNWPDRILESADCWRASYKVVLAQREKYPDWQILTHEELSANPVSTFPHLV